MPQFFYYSASISSGLLLDDFSDLSAIFSLRLLLTAYTGYCIRVRRSSDNAELDIGFVNGVLDTATLLTFCGAGNGYVTIWYDQSGNGNNSVQATATRQPLIVDSGTLITNNSKPSLKFTSAVGSSLSTGLVQLVNASTGYFTYSGVASVNATNADMVLFNHDNLVQLCRQAGASATFYNLLVVSGTPTASVASDTNLNILSSLTKSSDLKLYLHKNASVTGVSGNTFSTLPAGTSYFRIGHYSNNFYLDGYVSEFVMIAAENETARTAIRDNQIAYYGVA